MIVGQTIGAVIVDMHVEDGSFGRLCIGRVSYLGNVCHAMRSKEPKSRCETRPAYASSLHSERRVKYERSTIHTTIADIRICI